MVKGSLLNIVGFLLIILSGGGVRQPCGVILYAFHTNVQRSCLTDEIGAMPLIIRKRNVTWFCRITVLDVYSS